jgi:hypothetical protein
LVLLSTFCLLLALLPLMRIFAPLSPGIFHPSSVYCKAPLDHCASHLTCSVPYTTTISCISLLFLDYPKDGSKRLFQNVRNYLPVNTASYPRKLQYSETVSTTPKLTQLACLTV